MKRLLFALLMALIPSQGFGQASVLQGGSWTAGRVPMYSTSGGGSQPVVQQSAPASGGAASINEFALIARGTGTAPFVGQGTGFLGANFCSYDGPTTGAYHQFCISANATGGFGLMSYNAFGGASDQAFKFNLNGTTYDFPFVMPGTGVIGPGSSVVNDVACWNNTQGTLLKDCGTPSSQQVVATGGVTSLSLANRFGYILTVKDFGAVGNGIADDTAAFQAAVDSVNSGAYIQLAVPAGTYLLGSNVVSNGRVPSWQIMAAATFTGSGTLPFADTPNYGDKGIKNTFLALQRGTSAVPNSDPSPLIFAKKISSASATSGRNPTAMFAAEKRVASATNARTEAVFGETYDYVGGVGSFVEGGRFHGIVGTGAGGGSGYGAICVGGADSAVSWTYLIACEAEVINKTGAAPAPASFNKSHYAASYVATVGLDGTFSADAAFVTNPFTSGPTFRTGLLIAEDGVDFAGVANRATLEVLLVNYGSVATGIQTGTVSFAALSMENGAASVIRARNGANNAYDNILSYSNADQLVLGTDASSISLLQSIVYGGVTLNNAVTGTGNMVLSAGPTLTGTVVFTAGITAGGSPGLTTSKTVRDAAGTGTCTLQFQFGVLIGGTC